MPAAFFNAEITTETGGSSTFSVNNLWDEQGKYKLLAEEGRVCPWRRDFKEANDDSISWSKSATFASSAEISAEIDA
jgi:hypothetical protein